MKNSFSRNVFCLVMSCFLLLYINATVWSSTMSWSLSSLDFINNGLVCSQKAALWILPMARFCRINPKSLRNRLNVVILMNTMECGVIVCNSESAYMTKILLNRLAWVWQTWDFYLILSFIITCNFMNPFYVNILDIHPSLIFKSIVIKCHDKFIFPMFSESFLISNQVLKFPEWCDFIQSCCKFSPHPRIYASLAKIRFFNSCDVLSWDEWSHLISWRYEGWILLDRALTLEGHHRHCPDKMTGILPALQTVSVFLNNFWPTHMLPPCGLSCLHFLNDF